MIRKYRKLEQALGYRFRRKHLLETALTHPSFRYENPGVATDNQRLEFLGDAVLGAVSAAHLYEKYPSYQEGHLTCVRSDLTNTRFLARIAGAIDLGPWLRLGRGETLSGGLQRSSILTDALEAIVGAAFLDGGWKAAQRIFARLFVPEIQTIVIQQGDSNPKGSLQELCQRRWKQPPQYQMVSMEGPAHARRFTVNVLLGQTVMGRGCAHSRREAESEAAREALRHVERGDV